MSARGLIEAEVVPSEESSGDVPGLSRHGICSWRDYDESIRYPIRTPRDGAPVSPCVLAGPTCDSADVMYEKEPYQLPISLEIGDKVLIEGTGAYTATYSSVAFNGFPPLKTYHI